MTELERVWGDRTPDGGDPRPHLSDDLYAWVSSAGPAPQEPDEAAAALDELIVADNPAPASQSGPASHAYAAGTLRDPSRSAEFAGLLAAVEASQS
jgi:hypothetical protein